MQPNLLIPSKHQNHLKALLQTFVPLSNIDLQKSKHMIPYQIPQPSVLKVIKAFNFHCLSSAILPNENTEVTEVQQNLRL